MLVMGVDSLDLKITLLFNCCICLFPFIFVNNHLILSLIIFSPGLLWQLLNQSLIFIPDN